MGGAAQGLQGGAGGDATDFRARFSAHFGRSARLFRAPGRVNLIGEHTDYNHGFALAGAIDRECWVAIASIEGPHHRAVALDYAEEDAIDCEGRAPSGWRCFVWGALRALKAQGIAVAPCGVMVSSSVPQGAGVSSSAALSTALVVAFAQTAGVRLEPFAAAKIAQAVERDFVGVPCGLMDQWASACGRAGHLLQMDFQSATARPVAFANSLAILLIDSGARHDLSEGGYRDVRDACFAAAHAIGCESLRDATHDAIAALPAALAARARYVLEENARVLAMSQALAASDWQTAGALMSAGHAGLRDHFGVTIDRTDALQAIAARTPGVFGARQMGGGFGGSIVALVRADGAQAALRAILDQIQADHSIRANSFVATIVDGACEVAP